MRCSCRSARCSFCRTRTTSGSSTSAGTAQQRDVKMGQQQGSDWVVEEGLAPGDVVVVDGTQKLKPGTPVRIQPAAAPAAEPRAS